MDFKWVLLPIIHSILTAPKLHVILDLNCIKVSAFLDGEGNFRVIFGFMIHHPQGFTEMLMFSLKIKSHESILRYAWCNCAFKLWENMTEVNSVAVDSLVARLLSRNYTKLSWFRFHWNHRGSLRLRSGLITTNCSCESLANFIRKGQGVNDDACTCTPD